MRFARRLAGLSLLVVLGLGGGCDSTQPLQVEQQSVELSFQAVNALVKTFNVWDVFEDNNGDELPDIPGQSHFWCEEVSVSQAVNPASVPWNYSLTIQLLRAGDTVARNLTTPGALNLICPSSPPGEDPACNITAYETGPGQTQISAVDRDDICLVDGLEVDCPLGLFPPSGGRRFRFINLRRQSGATLNLMRAEPSPLFLEIQNDSMPPLGLGDGLCSAGSPGDVNIDGSPQPLSIEIGKGDTVIVKARLGVTPPQGGLNALIGDSGTPPNQLSAKMTLGGREINLLGTTSGESVSFSYTAR